VCVCVRQVLRPSQRERGVREKYYGICGASTATSSPPSASRCAVPRIFDRYLTTIGVAMSTCAWIVYFFATCIAPIECVLGHYLARWRSQALRPSGQMVVQSPGGDEAVMSRRPPACERAHRVEAWAPCWGQAGRRAGVKQGPVLGSRVEQGRAGAKQGVVLKSGRGQAGRGPHIVIRLRLLEYGPHVRLQDAGGGRGTGARAGRTSAGARAGHARTCGPYGTWRGDAEGRAP
jgi:hypothetical protein